MSNEKKLGGWQECSYRLTGRTALIFHNGQLADPLNYYAKEMKKLTGKKAKTEADHERIAEIEFKGGLYLNEDKRVIMPPEGIEAIVVAGAKKSKNGMNAKAGVYCPEAALLEYDGPTDPDELWKDERFRLTTGVKVQNKRLQRTRPIFRKWAATITLMVNTEMVNEEELFNWIVTAGLTCGSFDWRPKHGQFLTERVVAAKKRAA